MLIPGGEEGSYHSLSTASEVMIPGSPWKLYQGKEFGRLLKYVDAWVLLSHTEVDLVWDGVWAVICGRDFKQMPVGITNPGSCSFTAS